MAAFTTYFVAVNGYVKSDVITSFDSIIRNLTLTDSLVPHAEKHNELCRFVGALPITGLFKY